jgi:serine/threonine-protein kinase
MAAKDTLALVGQTFDNVRFDAIVDEGGFGYVYRGRHLGLDEPVAIKCLKVFGSSVEAIGNFEARFRDETRIAYRLSQGNLDICRSIMSGTLKTRNGVDVPYMVLEWLEGRTLSAEMRTRRANGRPSYSLDEATKLLESAAGALRHAHTEGVVHRDIKPSNLFIADTRDGRRVKVLDFGLAKIVDPEGFMQPESSPTAAHVFVCSPAYGAPEQFSKDIGAIGAWTDVYSFAFVLLELLCGHKVRDAKTLIEGMLKAVDPKHSSPSASELGVRVSEPVERVLARAVAHFPHDRWKDVGTMWDALHAAMATPDTHATYLDNVPKAEREEVMKRVEAFRASVIPGKGGTLAMTPQRAEPTADAAAESTAPMPGAPSKNAGSGSKVATAGRTLPLDTKVPKMSAPAKKSVSPMEKTLPLPSARGSGPQLPIAEAIASAKASAAAHAHANANADGDADADASAVPVSNTGVKLLVAIAIALVVSAGAYGIVRVLRR